MQKLAFDVLVIGGGASGLMAALEVALTGRSVAVIEAKERLGGRILGIVEGGLPVELGAEFVHGNLPLTQELLAAARAKTYKVKGSIWQHKKGNLSKQSDFIEDYKDLEIKFKRLHNDKSVADFLQEDLPEEKYRDLRFSLKNYVEGYYAADTTKASTLALCEELTKGDDEEQYRIEGGYGVLVDHLEKQGREKGVQIFLSQPVFQLQWKRGEVTAITEQETYKGKKVLMTVPVGVLQKEAITFFPALPRQKEAVQKLGYGHAIKIVMQFEKAFWQEERVTRNKDLADLGFLFSEELVPTWWAHYPKADRVLAGWLAGPRAAGFQFFSKEEIEYKAVFSLSKIFGLDVLQLRQMLTTVHFYNWSADPHFCGAYSYEVVNGTGAIEQLQKPVDETIFFAGEGLHSGPEIGTVEGALVSGRQTAQRLIASFTV